ncbi:MAG: hypothetical protein M1434_14970 [Chloroflexi bacterium]|nr:hypothetical protein [Chloroflexota bacterium]
MSVVPPPCVLWPKTAYVLWEEIDSERIQQPTTLHLVGGGALCLLGSPRRTLDIDYVGSDLPIPEDVLAATIRSLATELKLEVEGVPIDQFIPLPSDAGSRHLLIGRYGNLAAYVFDPYSIAISKIDRGFETDLQDVVFLIRQGLVTSDQLAQYAHVAVQRAQDFDIDPNEFRLHLAALNHLLG